MTTITVTDRYGYTTTKTDADLARLHATGADYMAFHLKNGARFVGLNDAGEIVLSYESA